MRFLHCIARFAPLAFFALISPIHAQRINISNFYYRDYLDFGQNKGVFKDGVDKNGAFTITGKDGKTLTIPHIPTFQASSNYGSLTSIGRGFAVTANHVESPNNISDLRQWGLTKYEIANQSVQTSDGDINGTSKPYGWDTKFSRLTKYVVEGQVGMLDIENSKKKDSTNDNLTKFKQQVESNFKDGDKIYLYQSGSGIVKLQGTRNIQEFYTDESGERRGGGFGTFNGAEYYGGGIGFGYNPSGSDFFNNISSGDSGSGIYAYDKNNNEWILLGVVSRDNGAISVASNIDFRDYQQNFESSIKINKNNLSLEKTGASPVQLKGNDNPSTLTDNKNIIFSGNGDLTQSGGITIEVKTNIDRNVSSNAGGFVFIAGDKATNTNPTTYKFTNANGQTYSFNGSGLDIGENVSVEWALKTNKGDSLHKVGKGELKIKTQNSESTNLGTLKIGEGKVTLDTDKKAYDNIYITSGRGELTLIKDKAEALGATKNNGAQGRSDTANATSNYKLEQKTNSEMGFYFGIGGGKLDLGGNSLTLNTIAANDKNAIVMSASQATLTIEGFGYESNSKSSNKKDTIIHATIGDTNANIDLQYSGSRAESKNKSSLRAKRELSVANHIDNTSAESQSGLPRLSAESLAMTNNSEAHLIFDGNINTKGKLSVTNGNVALQGHATAHATISDKSLIEKIKTAESGTQKGMPSYMDLSNPSHLEQPDWDNRNFKFSTGGITLTNSNLTLGRNATLESNITASNNSTIRFGGDVTHFIDNKDGKNVTGSGFSYQQEVQSGKIGTAQEQIANQTISYKGKITANGGTINSNIFDFNASLDLKSGANLNADYLTLTNSNTISLASGTSASVKTLKLQSVSESDLNKIFTNGSGNSKLKVTESFWFENTQNLTLSALDSANIDKSNYDIWATKSSVNDAQKEVSANVELFEGSNFVLKSLALKNITDSVKSTKSAESTQNAESSTKINRKTTKYLVHLGNTTSGSDFTKLTLSESLKADSLDRAEVILHGKSELKAKSIEFSNVKNGIMVLEKEAKLTGANGNANIDVKGEDSALKIYFDGEKKFDINASGGSSVVLSSLQASETSVANHLENNAELSIGLPRTLASARNDNLDSASNAKFSGKISAKDSSVVASDLESITASVDLSGTAKLTAQNIELTNGFDSIKLQGSANLTAEKITAKNVSQLTLQTNGAVASVSEFIFDGGTTNLNGDSLIGDKITLQNSSIVKNGELSFSSDSSVVFSDKDSKLEVTNLKVTSGTLSLNFNNAKQNGEKITKIDLSGSGNVNINSWDFGNATQFSGNGNGRVTFGNASYAQNGNAKTISADSTISGALSLSSVGQSTTQKARNANAQNATNRFESLKFDSKNLTLGESSTISVEFNSSISKSNYSTAGITLGTYYTLISASGITDNRANKIIDFKFSNESDKLFVVGKFFDGKELKIKFTESDPKTFSELVKHIDSRYSEVLKALTEAHPQDSAIELSANTDDYAVLESRVRGIDEAMNSIAQGNASRLMQNLLFSNDYTINTRVLQVRLARASQGKTPLRFAQSGTLYRLQKLRGEEIASDAMPSYRVESDSASLGVELPNSAWLNVGGGYFGGSAQMGFGATNIGYDRIFSVNGGDVMLGAMMGFGGSKGVRGGLSESAIFYNFGLYVDSVFDVRGGKYGGHELQSNLNFSVSENHKNFALDSEVSESHNQNAWSAKNSAFGTLLTLYYKYNFIVASSETISHAVKPIALLALGYNRNSAFQSAEYKQGAFGSASVAYGLGVEYNAVMSDSFYSISAVLKDIVWSGDKRVNVGLNGARNFISYTLESAPRFGVELNLIGSHKVYEMGENGALYVQYGITGMVDMGGNYGIKGDVKMGWRF